MRGKDGWCLTVKIERAIEILNPAHREHYESIEPVDEACRMGIAALLYRVRKKPEYLPAHPAPAFACKRCGSVKHLHNADGAQNAFCGQCGQAIDWTDAAETDA
jgi:hypothetical protein